MGRILLMPFGSSGDTRKMTAALTRLTESTQVPDNCKTYASRAAQSDALAKACDLIESFV